MGGHLYPCLADFSQFSFSFSEIHQGPALLLVLCSDIFPVLLSFTLFSAKARRSILDPSLLSSL
jgi:hypothetical protein